MSLLIPPQSSFTHPPPPAMPSFRTHITILQQVAASHPHATAFQVPEFDAQTNEVSKWHPVSYSRFFDDVELFAKYWTQKLTAQGIPPRSVVGVWYVHRFSFHWIPSHRFDLRIGGSSYVDCVHIYSMVRAGYVPQFFSLRLPEPDIIFELLAKSNGKALIYDSSFSSIMPSSPSTPIHMAIDVRSEDVADVSLPEIVEAENGDDTLMIFHTSGSTSGQPKVIRCSYSWWDACLAKSRLCATPKNPARQDVTIWMYVGQIAARRDNANID